jgi:hypothetical protein
MVELIGLPCLIGVTLNDDGFSEISSLLGRPKSAKSPVKPLVESVPPQDTPPAVVSDELPF